MKMRNGLKHGGEEPGDFIPTAPGEKPHQVLLHLEEKYQYLQHQHHRRLIHQLLLHQKHSDNSFHQDQLCLL